jgi:hypothetical protein
MGKRMCSGMLWQLSRLWHPYLHIAAENGGDGGSVGTWHMEAAAAAAENGGVWGSVGTWHMAAEAAAAGPSPIKPTPAPPQKKNTITPFPFPPKKNNSGPPHPPGRFAAPPIHIYVYTYIYIH